mmetsp:Transcript_147817/g.411666  ORF Transcript_147817/g.411666 Transcript_147817/m.411666 type:complete len:389 (-) Transcript_147817:165-1331(-)
MLWRSLWHGVCLICIGIVALTLAYMGSWVSLPLSTQAIVFYVLAALGVVSLLRLCLRALKEAWEEPPAQAISKTLGIVEALRKLKSLKEERLLTTEEYEKLRKETVAGERSAGARHAESQAQEEDPRGQIVKTATENSTAMFRQEALAAQLRCTTALLCDIYPRHVVRALQDGLGLVPERREVVTVFFSGIVGFPEICSQLTAVKVFEMLHRLYCKLDRLSSEFGVYKVETIGDTYMGVTNLITDQSTDHAKRVAQFAEQVVRVANETPVDVDNALLGCIKVRAGFDCGPIVAGVAGTRNRRYCLFGDTVNIASRMASASTANHVLCSERAAKVLQEQAPEVPVQLRGTIPVKGKGEMVTYWVKCSDLTEEYSPGRCEDCSHTGEGRA